MKTEYWDRDKELAWKVHEGTCDVASRILVEKDELDVTVEVINDLLER